MRIDKRPVRDWNNFCLYGIIAAEHGIIELVGRFRHVRIALEKQSFEQTINALAMASPFSLEEKQTLLETKNLSLRKEKLEEILKTYSFDNFDNNTIQ